MKSDTKQVLMLCVSTIALAWLCSACASKESPAASPGPMRARATVEFAIVADAKSPAPSGSRILEYKGHSYTLEPPRRFEIDSTSLSSDDLGYPAIGFEIAPAQKADFTRWTGEHVGRTLAVLIDGDAMMIVTIASALPGSGIIKSGTQTWSEKDARELASRIAPMK